MDTKPIGVDYSELHNLDSPVNRLLRDSIWDRRDDIGQQSFTTLRYMDDLIGRLGITEDTHILDVGAGTGGPAVYIANATGCRVTGIEINEVGVQVSTSLIGNAGLSDRVKVIQGDASQLPFEDESFDMAISLNVMNVFEDKEQVMRGVYRVLRPGGTWAFLSGTFQLGPEDAAAREHLRRGYLIPQYYDSLEEYKAKLRAAGFSIDEALEFIADFWVQVSRWRDAHRKHREVLIEDVGQDTTDYHIAYFDTYVSLIEQGKAANHLIVSHRPGGGRTDTPV
ncbi:MAG: methyltransferase domain-containing protein [Actinobacteria bacterium]|nr:methyltransferase domain-containing protein [Actinomycetota bacterium]